MKKVLILAYDFPPYVSVGGLRPHSWFRYFREFGIDPVVVTRQWSNQYGNHLDYVAAGESTEIIYEETAWGLIIKTPYKPNLSNRLLLKHGENKYGLLRKCISAFYEYGQFLFNIGTKVELYHGAKEYLSENKVDLIIATGDPFVLFRYAKNLSREFNIPWLADYRDPWSQYKMVQENIFLKLWYTSLERRIVRSASEIITVSEFVGEEIRKLAKDKLIHVLLNGYDPDVVDAASHIPQKTDALNIAFVGTIYDWYPWKSFLGVISRFKNERPEFQIRVNFYGTNKNDEIKTLLETEFDNLYEDIQIVPKIPNAELLRKLAENNVMLLFNNYSYMGTKIFDYVGIKRKIILCFSNGDGAMELKQKYYNIEENDNFSQHLQAELINETKSGIVIENEVHLFEVLETLSLEFQQKKYISCDSVGIENYSRKIQVKKLAEIIGSITKK